MENVGVKRGRSSITRRIYEVKFGYHAKRDGYATLMLDMLKLGETPSIRVLKSSEVKINSAKLAKHLSTEI